MNQMRISRSVCLIILVGTLCLNSCKPKPVIQSATPTETKLSQATSTVSQYTSSPTPSLVDSGLEVIDDGSSLPPKSIWQSPQGAEELALDGEIVLVFDQPMNTNVIEAHFQVTDLVGDKVEGNVTWSDSHTLHFRAIQPYLPDSIYNVDLDNQAESEKGIPLEESISFQIHTLGELQVSQVFPSDDSKDVSVESAITVIFNRPVVPLVISEETDALPNPLLISPTISGKGEWINTSVYAFHPGKTFKGGVTYKVTVKAGLEDVSGTSMLNEDYSWQFSTTVPGIESFSLSSGSINPEDNKQNVLLDEYFTIRFLQPMNHTSTENALTLVEVNGEKGEFIIDWSEDSTTLIFTPTQQLAIDTGYTLNLSTQALSIDGSTLSEELTWNFSTVPLPKIDSISPSNGSIQTRFNPQLLIQFMSPMRLDTVKNRIEITPKPQEEIQWWYSDYSWNLSAYFLQPSTKYEIKILPGMEDIYGNKIEKGSVYRFTTAAYSLSGSLLMPYDTSFIRANGPVESQEFYANFVNVKSVSFFLYKLTFEEYISFINSDLYIEDFKPLDSALIWKTVEKNIEELNQRVVKKFLPTTAEGKPLPPGFYLLGMDSPDIDSGGPFIDNRLIIVASANLTFKSSTSDSLVWLTDLETGKPIHKSQVVVYDEGLNAIGEGSTNKDGLVYLELPSPEDPYSNRFALVDDGKNFGFAFDEWGSGISVWDFGIWSSYYAPADQLKAYVYTERPIYRPGQSVYFKGVVRQDNDLDYRLPEQSKVAVKISNFKETVYESELILSDFGGFDGELLLDQEVVLGYYTLEVFNPEDDQSIGSITFNVAEYRKPEFQVKLNLSPKNILMGESFTAEVQADYYSGGSLEGADVSWTLTSEPFNFVPPDDLSSFNFTDIEEDTYREEDYEDEGAEIIAEGTGSTDSNGHFSLDLKADLMKAKSSRILTFEATVTDISKLSVSNRSEVIAHLSGVYPGVKPRSYVGIAGEEEVFELVALDWEGKRLSGQELTVEIVERKWYSVQEQDASGQVQWTSTVEEIPIVEYDEVVTDNNGLATVSFTPPNGGVFRAKVSSGDTEGNQGHASAYMWVSGDEFIPWRQTNDRSFDLVADKKNYSPGDIAEILIASPFQGEAYALVTAERGRIHHQEVILVNSNSTVYELPISSDLVPNVFVSVMVVKGVDSTNPRPNYKMGIVELSVNTHQQALTVEITPDRQTAGPGEQVFFDIRTTDYEGKPVSSEIAVGLSDLATLSLLPPNSPPILEFFFSERTLGVWTSVPIGLSLDEYNASIEEHIPGGEQMGSGGGKGEGELGVLLVRQDFPDTAFWEANIVTDEDGEAQVAVILPDNLTTWRMDARAATTDTLVGQSTQDIVSTKSLLIRPQTPRFFVANDEVQLGAVVQNNTEISLTVKVRLDAQGITLSSIAEQELEIAAGKQAFVSWNASVDSEATRADLVFIVEGGEYQDASRPPLGTLDNQGIPIYRYEARETVGTSGQLTTSGTKVESIYLPSQISAGEGELTIKASPSLAAGMTDGLTYLEHFPFECIEQTISRFLPNVITTQAMKAANLSDQSLEENLSEQVDGALQRLYNWQNADGGWGWWKGDASDPLTSAYVVMGLIEASKASYLVSDEAIDRGLNYLRAQILSIKGLTDPSLVNRQAFILYVLAGAGKPNVSATVNLYDQRQRMAIYSLAFLANTLDFIDESDPRLDTLKSDFNNSGIVSATGTHWEEKTPDRWNWNTDTRTTAIVLSTLSQIDPANPLNANAARWLMSNRSNGHWKGTQETAWSLIALTNWMELSGELQGNYSFAVALNDERLGGGVANSETLRQSLELKVNITDMLKDQANRLAFARDEGPGNFYYTAHLNVSLPVEETEALDQGIVVSREYYQLDNLDAPVVEAQQGDLLLARITIVAPNALHYVMIEDPLPAGLEAVDQTLSTSPQSVEVPTVYSWNDIFWRGWGWWLFKHIQMRDEKVVLSTDYLPAGTYVYTYLVRASTPGVFHTIPTTAQEFYFPEVYGRGKGSIFTINP